MKSHAQGDINKYISIARNPLVDQTTPLYPSYIIKGETHNLMIDAGINLLGPLYIEQIEQILGSKENLHYLFLTHSHYDHLGAVSYLKQEIPGLQIGGFPAIEKLLKKDSVLKRMNNLSEMQREIFTDIAGTRDLSIKPIKLDMVLQEGSSIDLGGLTCRVYESPGHTADSLSYYIPEIGALFPGEALGVPNWENPDEVQPEFLSSYKDYLESIVKLKALKPEIIGMPHTWYVTGSDAEAFFDITLSATLEYRALTENYLERTGCDIDKTLNIMMRKEYDEKGHISQERNAFLMNLTAQVNRIAEL
ncbi:MAG: MBL fold metallo-hydrolase [bacterium]|nr:MBL fold metallo-hydrolase [bacterium]